MCGKQQHRLMYHVLDIVVRLQTADPAATHIWTSRACIQAGETPAYTASSATLDTLVCKAATIACAYAINTDGRLGWKQQATT